MNFGEVRNQSPKEQAERVRRFGPSAAYLVIEASHEQEASAVGPIGDGENRDYCLALPNGFVQTTQERHDQFVSQIQAFAAFSIPNITGFQKIGHCVVANHPSGKPLYVRSCEMNARPSVLGPLPQGCPERILSPACDEIGVLSNHIQTSRGFSVKCTRRFEGISLRVHCARGANQ